MMSIEANQHVNIDLDFAKFEFSLDNLKKLICSNFKLINFNNANTKILYLKIINVSCTSIKSYYLADLIQLKILIINNNNIRIIHNNTFKGLISLVHLDLNYNNIIYIENDAFYGLVNLLSL